MHLRFPLQQVGRGHERRTSRGEREREREEWGSRGEGERDVTRGGEGEEIDLVLVFFFFVSNLVVPSLGRAETPP